MVRASTMGMIDFKQFDPWDMWWWRKLKWVLNELELQQTIDVCKVQHSHWITLASHSRLTEDSFSKAKTNAGMFVNRLLQATYPWMAEEIGKDATLSERDDAVAAYRQMFGSPGEPRYEAMMDTIYKWLAENKRKERTANRS